MHFPVVCHDPLVCSCCGGVHKSLLDLDSFDLAFLMLTKHVAFQDEFDTTFLAIKEAKKRAKWGPHATLMEIGFSKAWNIEGAPLAREVTACFDLSGNISVDRKKVEKILGSAQFKSIGLRIWARVQPALNEMLDTLQMEAMRYFLRQYADANVKKDIGGTGIPASGDFSLEDWNLFHQAATQDHMKAFAEAYPSRVLPDQINTLVNYAETLPGARTIDQFNLNRRIKAISDLGGNYLGTLSDVEMGRLWGWTGVELAYQAGATEYQILSQRDKITCPVCTRLDGKVFKVANTRENVNSKIKELDLDLDLSNLSSGSSPVFLADTISAAFPFPRMKDVDNIPPSQLPKSGLVSPFHNR